jgi:GDP-L-fucose synthase
MLVVTYIAGHRGLVGSSLIRNIPVGVKVVTASKSELEITDAVEVEAFLRDLKVESVIMAAAKVGGIFANSSNHYDFLLQNLLIQNGIIEGARRAGVKNLIFLGSSCIYPRNASQPLSENQLLTGVLEKTNENYALAKIVGIKLCQAIAEELDFNYVSLMPTNLYGPNDNFHLKDSHVPAALMRRFHEAKVNNRSHVTVWGSGTPLREFMHVDDLADACWHFLNKYHKGELINIGTGKEISIKDFALILAKITGFDGEIIFDTEKPDGTPRKLLDIKKANSYGWVAKIQLVEGLNLTYNWFTEAYEKKEIRGY